MQADGSVIWCNLLEHSLELPIKVNHTCISLQIYYTEPKYVFMSKIKKWTNLITEAFFKIFKNLKQPNIHKH